MEQKDKNWSMSFRQRQHARHMQRRRGAVAIYLAMLMVVILGMGAFVVDMGLAYRKQADLQRVSDNAAMAGASALQQGYAAADALARVYATRNGYTHGVNGVTITTEQPTPIRLRVAISMDQQPLFYRIVGREQLSIAARATAEYAAYAGLTVQNNGNVASIQAALVNNGPFALGPIGNASVNSYGDYYSAMYTNDGSAANAHYDPNGYNFLLSVPSNFKNKANSNGDDHSKLWVEIFDPESNGNYDEVHSPASQVKTLAKNQLGITTTDKNRTTYIVYYDALSLEGKVTSSTPITSREFDPSKSNYTEFDEKWTQGMLEVNLNNVDLTKGRLRLQVKSSNGASENGFYIRTGPKHPTNITESQWESRYGPGKTANGTAFVAQGRTSFNFWKAGTADVDLGYVPKTAAGGNIRITYYDLEGGTALRLLSDNNTSSGVPTNGINVNFQRVNGVEGTYEYTLPANFQGGNFSMTYTAGKNDSSSWQVSYPGPGEVYLRLVE